MPRTSLRAAVVAMTVLAAAITQAPIAAAEYPYPGTVTGDVAVHDPSMVKAADGTYFLFSTGEGIEIRTSTDRTAFRRAGSAFPNGASWAHPFTGGSNTLWAPDVSFHNGRY
ncbi:MAG: family 43 glycosylhydrolase, partial [Actinomycetota bacterium]|nr:family 43 glycosylhydrolase [Actinomycetota bacterium]